MEGRNGGEGEREGEEEGRGGMEGRERGRGGREGEEEDLTCSLGSVFPFPLAVGEDWGDRDEISFQPQLQLNTEITNRQWKPAQIARPTNLSCFFLALSVHYKQKTHHITLVPCQNSYSQHSKYRHCEVTYGLTFSSSLCSCACSLRADSYNHEEQ